MLKEKLVDIGFNNHEADIYIELLTIGPQAASTISKRLGINRSTTYSILKTLGRKGVVSSYKNSCMKYYLANDPNCLIGYIDGKCKTYNYYRSQLLSLIPQFREVVMDYDFKKPVVSYFEGIEGVRYVLNECLNVEEEFRVYLPLKRLFEYGLKEFFLKIGKRVLDKEVLLKIIVLDSPEVREFFDKNFDLEDENIQILILSDSKDMALFECGMCIFDEKVALMHFDGQDEYGVLIQSREIANMHKNVFDVSWNGFKMDGKK